MYLYSQLKEDSTRFLDDFCTLYLSWIPRQDYILFVQKVSCAVVAQPGRALDL
jgi:hypothetical protein